MNSLLDLLEPYPFEKMHALKTGIDPVNLSPINLSIGEPKHRVPKIISDALVNNIDKISEYPLTKGTGLLRETIKYWLKKRFHLYNICAESQILPVNGTREALFAFAQTVLEQNHPLVLMSNPFYQIYEGAALLAGANIEFLNLLKENQFQPDFSSVSPQTWKQCQLIYICSPNNPTGSVLHKKTLKNLIQLSQKYNFIIASDECYSEIYFDENNPPVGLLEVADEMGLKDFNNCVIFHSLSKRSNVPGLRSGFVAGDAKILQRFLLYRTYQGCAMPIHHQLASIQAWQDEKHVIENRNLYREKFQMVVAELDINATLPDAGFYLWLQCPVSDLIFTKDLFQNQNVTVVPGSFLSRNANGINPGQYFVRIALVTDIDECIMATQRINQYTKTL